MHHLINRITHNKAFVTPVVEQWLEQERLFPSKPRFAHGAMGLQIDPSVDPLSYFSFQPVLHDWCNKGCGMCYPVCGMMHIKEPLLLIGKSSLCGGSGFPLSLSVWSFTICLTQ